MAFSDFIPVDGDTQTDQGTWLRHISLGTKNYQHEPTDFSGVPMVHRTQTQMLQLAPGHRWCKTCGDVRRNSYFDVLEYDEDGTPVKYNHECRQCVNSRDPELATEKYCNACRVMHPRDDFADDTAYRDKKYHSCNKSEARRKAAKRAQDAWLNEGRMLRQWNSRAG